MSFVNYTEMARVTGVPFNYLNSHARHTKVLTGADYDWQKVSIVMGKIRPDFDAHIPIGKPDEPSALDHGTYKVDTSKSIRELVITCESSLGRVGVDRDIDSKPEHTWGDLLDYFGNIGAVKA